MNLEKGLIFDKTRYLLDPTLKGYRTEPVGNRCRDASTIRPGWSG